ncbi:hypothetical protein FOCC_FOCC002300, partial [Frankliniella occidentalis]
DTEVDTVRGHRSVVPGVATRATRITTSRVSITSHSHRQRRNHRGTSLTIAGGAPQDTRERRGQDCVVGARFTAGHGSPLRGARSRLWHSLNTAAELRAHGRNPQDETATTPPRRGKTACSNI